MILVIVVVRALLLHKLPKRAFLFLWGIVLARLLIPYTLPCSFSAYSLLSEIGAPQISETAGNITVPPSDDPTLPPMTDLAPSDPVTPFEPDLSPGSVVMPPAPEVPPENGLPFDIGTAVWIAGMAACTVFFSVSYIKCRVKFRESLPVESPYIAEWLAEHKLRRRISVRRSDRIAAPLTYGILRPVILLPKNYEKIDPNDLRFVLAHEYVHIRRFDAVFKVLLTAAVCVHWFNPLVWAMYVIANKDIEISCDEAVITMLGETEKQSYALTLIRMEEIKSGFTPLISSFGNNAIKERIVTIMKFKKTTALTAAAAAFLAVGITTAFATSAKSPDNTPDSTTSSDTVSAPISDTTSTPDTTSSGTPDSKTTLPETVTPPAEPKISVEDWLKQPHNSPLANMNVEFDSTGKYTAYPAALDTEVLAIDDGEVVYAEYGFNEGWGNAIVIKHDNDFYTVYGHLEMNHGIKANVGDTVKAGQCIGYVGISGKTSEYALGFKCTDKMPDLQPYPTNSNNANAPAGSVPAQSSDDYDYMIPIEGGFYCGKYSAGIGVIPNVEMNDAEKATIDYFLEKYADHVTLTPPDCKHMALPYYDENGKLVVYYIPMECISKYDFLAKTASCPNYQSGSCETVCRDRDCPIHGYNYSQQSGTQQYGGHHYESHHYGSHHYESHH